MEGQFEEKHEEECGVSATVKRARTLENEKHPQSHQSEPKFFLVMLGDAYGTTENYPAYYTCWSKLTPEQREALYRSVPSSRAGCVPGCDDDHDFGEGRDHILEGNIWTCLTEDEQLSAFTRANHCEMTVAYFNE
jgi:hypothetical protein